MERHHRKSLGRNLRLATAVMGRRLKRVLIQKGIDLTEYVVLRELGHQDGIPLFEISNLSRRSAKQLTRGVKSLKKKGLVRGVIRDSDKRVIYLFLTGAGKELLRQVSELREELVGSLGLSPEEVKALCKLTDKIIRIDDRLEGGEYQKYEER